MPRVDRLPSELLSSIALFLGGPRWGQKKEKFGDLLSLRTASKAAAEGVRVAVREHPNCRVLRFSCSGGRAQASARGIAAVTGRGNRAATITRITRPASILLVPRSREPRSKLEMNDAVTTRETIRIYLPLPNNFLARVNKSTLSKRSLTFLSNLTGLTGMKRHATAMLDPVKAIQTTDTAEGTRAANAPKWSFANKNPKAELFIEVSMAIVRDDVSPKPRARAPQ